MPTSRIKLRSLRIENVKLGITDTCVCKNIYKKRKIRLKTEQFFLRLVLINQVFARTLTTFSFRCKIISVKLVFGVKTLPQKLLFLLLMFINNKCYKLVQLMTSNKGFVPTSMTDSVLNSVQFLAYFYKIVT